MTQFVPRVVLLTSLMLSTWPVHSQTVTPPPFTLGLFSVNPTVLPLPPQILFYDIFFNSAVPLVQVTLFFRGPDNFHHPIPILFTQQIPAAPNVIYIGGPTPIVPPLAPGLYTLTRVNAVNSLNQNLDLQAPTNPVPIATFTVLEAPIPDPPMALTAFSAAPFRVTGPATGVSDFSATITTASALSNCRVAVNPPSGNPINVPLFQSSFDSSGKSAVATGALTISDPALPNGNYTITGLSCSNAGNQTLDVTAANFPGGAPPPLPMNRCPMGPAVAPRSATDTAAPVISCVAISPATVDTAAAGATVTVHLSYNDYESGVSSFGATLTSPNGIVYQSGGGPGADLALQRNGQIFLNFNLPRYAPGGTYRLSLTASDQVGNSRTYSNQDLITLGLPNTVQVTDATPDTVPPTLVSLAFEPSTIDSSLGKVAFTVRVALRDNLSGVSPSISITSKIPGQSFQNRRFSELSRVSGTDLDGVWVGTLYAERFDFAGTYQADSVTIQDRAGNTTTVNSLPATYTQIANPSDHERPKLLSFDFNPKVINTVGTSQTITYTSSWSDDTAGFEPGFGAEPKLSLRSPSALVTLSSRSSDCTRLSSGNPFAVGSSPRSVVYRCTLTVPNFSEAGPWTVLGLNINDAARFGAGPQGAALDTATLASLGFPTRLFNIVPGDFPDGFIGPAGGSVTPASDALFTLAVPANLFATNTAVTMRLNAGAGNLPIPQGFSAAATNLANIDLQPLPATPLLPPGATLTMPTSGNLPPGTTLGLYRLDPNSGALTPAPSLQGGFVTGLVNANGNAATFTGLSALPTLVAFRRNAEVIGDVNGDGQVTCVDVALVRAALGKRTGQAGFDARADLNRDGVVDIRDVTAVSRLLPSGTQCL